MSTKLTPITFHSNTTLSANFRLAVRRVGALYTLCITPSAFLSFRVLKRYSTTFARVLKEFDTLRKTGRKLVWGSHSPLHGVANVKSSVANDETGFKVSNFNGPKRPLGRPRRRWMDNIRMDLQEVGCGYMDWIGLAPDRDRWRTLVRAVMNLRVPRNAGNFLTSCKAVSFSRRTLHHGVSK